MGRACPAASSCCFLPRSLEGLESRAAALGRRAGVGVWTPGFFRKGLPGESGVRERWEQRAEGRGPGVAAGKKPGVESLAGSAGTRPRPLLGLRPAPPSRSPLSSDKAVAAPRPAPRFLSVPTWLPLSLLLLPPPPLPPVSGSPSIPLSSSSSCLLSPDARLLRTPSPASPAACELTEGLQTWGGAVSLLSPFSCPWPGPWADSSLCRDCLSVLPERGGDG